jgi:hypothetical protein
LFTIDYLGRKETIKGSSSCGMYLTKVGLAVIINRLNCDYLEIRFQKKTYRGPRRKGNENVGKCQNKRHCQYIRSRVDVIWRSHLGILCIPCYSSLSIEECHNILPYERASTPLAEPDL